MVGDEVVKRIEKMNLTPSSQIIKLWWFSKSENSQKIKSGKLMFGGNGEQKHFFFVPFTTKNIIDFYEVDGIVVCYDM